jgi:hypothetical protein
VVVDQSDIAIRKVAGNGDVGSLDRIGGLGEPAFLQAGGPSLHLPERPVPYRETPEDR